MYTHTNTHTICALCFASAHRLQSTRCSQGTWNFHDLLHAGIGTELIVSRLILMPMLSPNKDL